MVFHIINNCHHNGIHSKTDEYILTHHYHLESTVCSRLLLVLCTLCLDKCVMMCIHIYSSRQNSFHCPKIFWALHFHSSLLSNPWQTYYYYIYILTISVVLLFPDIIMLESESVVFLDWLLSLCNMSLSFLCILMWLDSYFVFSAI